MSADPLHDELLALAARLGGPLLAIDTSGPVSSLCTVALTPGAVHERELPASSMPSESLVPALAEELAASGRRAAELRAIVVGLGPGSFTGLRVGLATVKGLAYGAGVPVYGTSSSLLLAAPHGPGLVAAALNARRGEIYAALYEVSPALEPRVLVADEVTTPERFAERLHQEAPGSVALVGDAAPLLEGVTARLVVPAPVPRAALGLLLERERIVAGRADDLMSLAPRYLKASEAERMAGRG